MAYTTASTSAFLTQCYCLWIPVWVARRDRSWPSLRVWLSCAMVIAGVAALAKVDWQQVRLGRGELETIAASVLFTVANVLIQLAPSASSRSAAQVARPMAAQGNRRILGQLDDTASR